MSLDRLSWPRSGLMHLAVGGAFRGAHGTRREKNIAASAASA